jgi:hypothetical protein
MRIAEIWRGIAFGLSTNRACTIVFIVLLLLHLKTLPMSHTALPAQNCLWILRF